MRGIRFKGFENVPKAEAETITEEPPKPPEPEKPKDELTEQERKVIEVLKAHNGDCPSANKLFNKALGLKTGESTQKIEKWLIEKGFIAVEKPNPTKKIIRLTEKGKAYHPR